MTATDPKGFGLGSRFRVRVWGFGIDNSPNPKLWFMVQV